MSDTLRLPSYRCHKVVQADKVVGFTELLDPDEPMDYLLHLECGQKFAVNREWFEQRAKGAPIGGYLVIYEDGYISWSPAKAFEEGYTRVEESDE